MSKHKFLFKHSEYYNSSRLSSPVVAGIGKQIEQHDCEQHSDILPNKSSSIPDFSSPSKYEDNLPIVSGQHETYRATTDKHDVNQLASNSPGQTFDYEILSFSYPAARTAQYIALDQAELESSTSLHLTRIGDGQFKPFGSRGKPCSASQAPLNWSDDYPASQHDSGLNDHNIAAEGMPIPTCTIQYGNAIPTSSAGCDDALPTYSDVMSSSNQRLAKHPSGSQEVQRSIPTGVITRAPPVRTKVSEAKEKELDEVPSSNLLQNESSERIRRGPKRKWSLKNIIEHPGTPIVYECKVCKKKFRNKNNCKYHQHKDAVFHYTCDICGKGMMAKTHYEYHMKKHKGAREFVCTECPKTFITSNDLIRHQQVHQQNVVKTLHKCSACPRTFQTEALLRRHTAVHDDEQRVTCQKCNTQFASFAELRDHGKAAHSDSKKFKCTVCSTGFERQKHLDEHSTIHTGERAYECPHCPRRFRTERSLNTHKMNHEGDRPYKCGKCNRRFLLQKDCLRHESVHNDDKPFGCDLCDKSFRRSDNLQRHVRLHHGEDDVLGLDAAELVQGMLSL